MQNIYKGRQAEYVGVLEEEELQRIKAAGYLLPPLGGARGGESGLGLPPGAGEAA